MKLISNTSFINGEKITMQHAIRAPGKLGGFKKDANDRNTVLRAVQVVTTYVCCFST